LTGEIDRLDHPRSEPVTVGQQPYLGLYQAVKRVLISATTTKANPFFMAPPINADKHRCY
ncbi:MAG: hypothetical protein AAGD11_11435, partial [Planctomycetota bacterium]